MDAVLSSRHVRVMVDGSCIAETRRPVAVFETGLPTRWYMPKPDVRLDLLVPSDTLTRCPYKGLASHFHVEVNGSRHEDLAWTYPYTTSVATEIGDLVAFYDERVAEVWIDGEMQEKPRAPFSR